MQRERLLNNGEISRKCHLGEGARCCRYLGAGAKGIECLLIAGLKKQIDERVSAGLFTAQATACADPFDSFSECHPAAFQEHVLATKAPVAKEGLR
jgi:hypothetical protein